MTQLVWKPETLSSVPFSVILHCHIEGIFIYLKIVKEIGIFNQFKFVDLTQSMPALKVFKNIC